MLPLVLSFGRLAFSEFSFAALSVVSTVLFVVSTVLFVVSPALVAALLASSPALLAESAAEFAAPSALSAARWLSCAAAGVSSARAVVVLPNPSASAPANPSPISTFRMRHLQRTAPAVYGHLGYGSAGGQLGRSLSNAD